MQTGIINSDNISQVLRGIAQKRQNGCLEIVHADEKVNILFSNGKIIDAFRESENSVSRAARRIEKTDGSGSAELMRIVVKNDVMNFLFSLDLGGSSFFTFHNYIPEFEKEYAANISVGQYLLDKASLDAEQKRFYQIFADNSRLLKLELADLELLNEEKIFYDSIEDNISVRDLMSKSIFSRYAVIVFLLSFYERAIIEIMDNEAARPSSDDIDLNIINVLEDSSVRPYVETSYLPRDKSEDLEDSTQYQGESKKSHSSPVSNYKKVITNNKKELQNIFTDMTSYDKQAVIINTLLILSSAVIVSFFWTNIFLAFK